MEQGWDGDNPSRTHPVVIPILNIIFTWNIFSKNIFSKKYFDENELIKWFFIKHYKWFFNILKIFSKFCQTSYFSSKIPFNLKSVFHKPGQMDSMVFVCLFVFVFFFFLLKTIYFQILSCFFFDFFITYYKFFVE